MLAQGLSSRVPYITAAATPVSRVLPDKTYLGASDQSHYDAAEISSQLYYGNTGISIPPPFAYVYPHPTDSTPPTLNLKENVRRPILGDQGVAMNSAIEHGRCITPGITQYMGMPSPLLSYSSIVSPTVSGSSSMHAQVQPGSMMHQRPPTMRPMSKGDFLSVTIDDEIH